MERLTIPDIKKIIESEVNYFIDQYCTQAGIENIWQEPIIKYADAKNPMFEDLKAIVLENHYTPAEILEDAESVLSYFLPFKEEVAKSNVGGKETSEIWANAYLLTNELSIYLNEYLIETIRDIGYHAAMPINIGLIEDVLKSRWSQRHVAYLAGHGTFGLNNMLITEKGCAGRYFSIITALPIEADPIVQVERCLYKRTGKCKACIKRCPTGALTEQGFDRFLCYAMCLENEKKYKNADVCGKCVVGVPCSFRSL